MHTTFQLNVCRDLLRPALSHKDEQKKKHKAEEEDVTVKMYVRMLHGSCSSMNN